MYTMLSFSFSFTFTFAFSFSFSLLFREKLTLCECFLVWESGGFKDKKKSMFPTKRGGIFSVDPLPNQPQSSRSTSQSCSQNAISANSLFLGTQVTRPKVKHNFIDSPKKEKNISFLSLCSMKQF